jgi:hypothetical protein
MTRSGITSVTSTRTKDLSVTSVARLVYESTTSRIVHGPLRRDGGTSTWTETRSLDKPRYFSCRSPDTRPRATIPLRFCHRPDMGVIMSEAGTWTVLP